jgi:hypothetical protein
MKPLPGSEPGGLPDSTNRNTGCIQAGVSASEFADSASYDIRRGCEILFRVS